MTDIDLPAIEAERDRIRTTYLKPGGTGSPRAGCTTPRCCAADVERTVKFYQEVLEFPLTEIFENRDYEGSNHFFFDIGNGNLLAFFDFPGLDLGPYAEVLGGLHHIAISVEPEQWEQLKHNLDEAGVRVPGGERYVDLLPRPRWRPDRADRRPARRDVRPEGALTRERDGRPGGPPATAGESGGRRATPRRSGSLWPGRSANPGAPRPVGCLAGCGARPRPGRCRSSTVRSRHARRPANLRRRSTGGA